MIMALMLLGSPRFSTRGKNKGTVGLAVCEARLYLSIDDPLDQRAKERSMQSSLSPRRPGPSLRYFFGQPSHVHRPVLMH